MMETVNLLETLKWIMILCQLIVWAWFSSKGGQLADKQFLVFTGGMLLGMIASSVETYYSGAWGTFVIQVYFFAFTAMGGIRRLRSMQAADASRIGTDSRGELAESGLSTYARVP
jgi:hypothetical protein